MNIRICKKHKSEVIKIIITVSQDLIRVRTVLYFKKNIGGKDVKLFYF